MCKITRNVYTFLASRFTIPLLATAQLTLVDAG